MTAVRKLVTGGPVTRATLAGRPRDVLANMAERIAKAIDDSETHPRDLAALTRRLHDIVNDLEAIDAREPGKLSVVATTADDDDFDPSTV